jgi:hypothetical protein
LLTLGVKLINDPAFLAALATPLRVIGSYVVVSN